ncbi:hypothetical protein ACLESD_00320 [Pyxidicoccus sp. 3LFB2]
MAVAKKGWRKIRVADADYFWRANGTDWGIHVVVVGPAAFVSGQRAQQLGFTLDYDALRTPIAGGVGLWQRAAVAPGVVRFALERALAATPPFTGEAGRADVSLSKEDQQEAQRLARLPIPQRDA